MGWCATFNWSNSTNISTSWEGVTVAGTPARVTRLNVHGATRDGATEARTGGKLNGVVPSELGSLDALTFLWLNDNELTGSIPASLNRLTNITQLELRGNKLTGTTPDLSALTNLQKLAIHNNQLNGTIPASLGSLSNLTHLWLGNNQLTSPIPSSPVSYTHLTLPTILLV